MPPQISTPWYLVNFTLSGASIGLIYTTSTSTSTSSPLYASLGFSGLCFAATFSLVTWLGPSFKRIGLKGKDVLKREPVELPESMGAVVAIVYLLAMFAFIPFAFLEYFVTTSGGGNRDVLVEGAKADAGRRFPHNRLGEYLAVLLSLQSTLLLGFLDDLFDIRWRHKLFIPALSSIPLLVVYYVDFGVTTISLPRFLSPYFGNATILDLGWLYYAYMSSVLIFCPNSINILAGINGLEVGQSLAIAVAFLANDYLYLRHPAHPASTSHLFSTYFLLPFIGASLALFLQNRYPARVFVGDTYCYFAGMVFAAVAVMGHFSKTLMLLFIPQIFNFILSAPQLFHIVPCPRHRMPRLNKKSGRLEPSWAEVEKVSTLGTLILKVLETMRLTDVKRAPSKAGSSGSGEIKSFTNLTLLNLWVLRVGGDQGLREDVVSYGLIGLQLACGCAGIFVRHTLALLVFWEDNLGGNWVPI